jgi:hypothetical protein
MQRNGQSTEEMFSNLNPKPWMLRLYRRKSRHSKHWQAFGNAKRLTLILTAGGPNEPFYFTPFGCFEQNIFKIIKKTQNILTNILVSGVFNKNEPNLQWTLMII